MQVSVLFLYEQILNLMGKSSSALRSQTVDEDLSSTDSISSSNDQSVREKHSLCGKLGCYEGKVASVSLGKTRYRNTSYSLIYKDYVSE